MWKSIDDAIAEEKELYEIAKDRYEKLNVKNCGDRAEEHSMMIAWLEELKQYKDAEEQGILLRLKLKVGEDFWELNNGVVYSRRAHSLQHVLYCMDRLGKVTFLTKEAAEQALNQMRGE